MKTTIKILAFALAVGAGLTPSLRGAQGEWKTHTDTKYRFTFVYPADWTLRLSEPERRYFVTSPPADEQDDFWENVNCVVLAAPPGILLRNVEQGVLEKLKTLLVFKLLKSEFISSDQTEAWEYVYTTTTKADPGGTRAYHLKVLQRIQLSKGLMFVFTFTSEAATFDRYVADAQRVISSLTLE